MWFLREDVAADFSRFRREVKLTDAAQAEFAEKLAVEAGPGGPRNLNVAGDVAEITVDGLLTERLDVLAWLFGLGNTTYRDIRESVAQAEQDPNVKRIVFNIASPGGHVSGLFETLNAINSATKPMSVNASQATSAAYAIAAAAGKITAQTRASEFGSIGVAVTMVALDEIIDITSSAAPKKRPDPRTEEGKAVIREQLDAMHAEFVAEVAKGRGIDIRTVNAEFGQGATLLAAEAKKRGMIDRLPAQSRARGARAEAAPVPEASARVGDDVASTLDAGALGFPGSAGAMRPTDDDIEAEQTQDDPEPPSPGEPEAAAGGTTQEMTRMDLETLKKEHPAVYAQAFAEGEAKGEAKGREAGEQAGVEQERKRCVAHIKLGTSSGDMELAHRSIASGVSSMDEEVFASYQSAAMKRRDLSARAEDDKEAVAAVEGAQPAPEQDLGDQVVAALEAQGGV